MSSESLGISLRISDQITIKKKKKIKGEILCNFSCVFVEVMQSFVSDLIKSLYISFLSPILILALLD